MADYTKYISKTQLKKFLKENETKIFKKKEPCLCPLANFLRVKGYKGVNVGVEICGTNDLIQFYDLKKDKISEVDISESWISEFISGVDTYPNGKASLSGKEALEVLNNLEL